MKRSFGTPSALDIAIRAFVLAGLPTTSTLTSDAAPAAIASIFAWTRALQHRGRMDDTPDVVAFAEAVERVCISTVEEGKMTKDLALLVGEDQGFLTTEEFLDAIDSNLSKEMQR